MQVDVAMEVGLGGRIDFTNVVCPTYLPEFWCFQNLLEVLSRKNIMVLHRV